MKNEGERFARFLQGLSDYKLAEQITEDRSQPAKSRLEALMSPKDHEMHSRGQLMLMERMLVIVRHLTRKYAEMEQEMREAAEKKSGPTAQAGTSEAKSQYPTIAIASCRKSSSKSSKPARASRVTG
ncbi:MAG: hypothetical protein H7039_23015 [Bryobacteraceae bacterium]|nr:hypothetical protein [Bryobacteraceae bacterium]